MVDAHARALSIRTPVCRSVCRLSVCLHEKNISIPGLRKNANYSRVQHPTFENVGDPVGAF